MEPPPRRVEEAFTPESVTVIRAAVDSLHRPVSQATLDELASRLDRDSILRVPHLGIEVAGRDTILAYLSAFRPVGPPCAVIEEIVVRGSFTIAFVGPTSSCHVFSASGRGSGPPGASWRRPTGTRPDPADQAGKGGGRSSPATAKTPP